MAPPWILHGIKYNFTRAKRKEEKEPFREGGAQSLGGGDGKTILIAYTPVTNGQYADFLKATGRPAPKDWKEGRYLAGKEAHPVVNVGYPDAVAYCQWLTATLGQGRYRLPTAEEWEIAAGHMPKDADFNNGENPGTTPVTQDAMTQAACGAVDMWGNAGEWTSTAKAGDPGKSVQAVNLAVKGGAWNTPRTACRTEAREEFRQAASGYEKVGFRVVRER